MSDQLDTIPGTSEDALLRRIERLQLAYVHTIDDGNLDGWPDFFTDPCLYTIIARDNVERGQELGVMRFESVGMLRDRATATQQAAVFAPRTIRHIVGGTLLEEDGTDGIRARTNVAIYQSSADGDTLLLMAAQYRDLIIDVADTLKFREKRVVYDTLRLPDSIVYPL